MIICKYCNSQFDNNKIYANHIRWKHKDNKRYFENMSNQLKIANDTRYGKRIEEEVICSSTKCENIIKIKYRPEKRKEKYFCSRSCANSRSFTKDTLNKISESVSKSIKEKWKDPVFSGKILNRKSRFNSKNELLISNYFKLNFQKDEWKSGGALVYKNEIIVRDLWSDKLKICFEYDGIVHFKDIYGQLERKQKKDNYLKEWCIKNNYRLIRIEDGYFIDFKQIYDLFYNNIEDIVLIGKSY